MSCKKTEIDCTCGIFHTWYTLRDYGKKIVVTAPYVLWVNNSGNLAFEKWTFTDPLAIALLRDMAENECLISSSADSPVSITDLRIFFSHSVRRV